jgi:hypothetical protein
MLCTDAFAMMERNTASLQRITSGSKGPEKTAECLESQETTEVLKLATAAIDGPNGDAAAQLMALEVHTELSEGRPLTLEGYHAKVQVYAVITEGVVVPIEDDFPGFRAFLAGELWLKSLKIAKNC